MDVEDKNKVGSKGMASIEALDTFVDVCTAGLHYSVSAEESVKKMEQIKEITDKFGKPLSEDAYKKALSEARKVEEFSKEQSENGYPYLFGIATIKLWSIIESTIDDLAVQRVMDHKSCADIDLIKNIRGPLVDFMEAGDNERAEYLASELKHAVKANLQKGIGKFESILKPLGLSGTIPSCIRKAFVEHSEVRNLIVHRNSIADKRFVQACPWISSIVGETVITSAKNYHLYRLSCLWYVIDIHIRVEKRDGRNVGEDLIQALGEYIPIIEGIINDN